MTVVDIIENQMAERAPLLNDQGNFKANADAAHAASLIESRILAHVPALLALVRTMEKDAQWTARQMKDCVERCEHLERQRRDTRELERDYARLVHENDSLRRRGAG